MGMILALKGAVLFLAIVALLIFIVIAGEMAIIIFLDLRNRGKRYDER